MSSRTFTRAKTSTEETQHSQQDNPVPAMRFCVALMAAVLFLLLLVPPSAFGDWKVDLSRRQKNLRQSEAKAESATRKEEPGVLDYIFQSDDPIQEVVLLNTERGFVPQTVRLRKGAKYVIHVVNINEKEKNISFVLDAFSEHHATFYGQQKTFRLEPKKEGIYSFQCPETSSEGRMIVYAPAEASSIRSPASSSDEKGGK